MEMQQPVVIPTSPTPPGERLRERCLGANDVFYAVHRTDLLRRHFEAVRDCNPRDLFLMEQLVMFLTAIAGKTRQLDTLYIARQQDSPGSSGGAHQDRFGDWYDRMLLPTWSEDFTRFVDCAAAALSRADGIPAEEARRTVVESYKMSVAPSLLADLVEEPTVSCVDAAGAAGGPAAGQPAAHERASPRGAGVLPAHALALARFRSRHRISDPAGARGRAGIHAGANVPDRRPSPLLNAGT